MDREAIRRENSFDTTTKTFDYCFSLIGIRQRELVQQLVQLELGLQRRKIQRRWWFDREDLARIFETPIKHSAGSRSMPQTKKEDKGIRVFFL